METPVTYAIDKPKRWDVPYDPAMTMQDLERLLSSPPFKEMDPDRFPEQTPLPYILLNDTRLINLQAGEVIYKQGDYENSAFLVLEGEATSVLHPGLDTELLGRREKKTKTLIHSFSQLFSRPSSPETRCLATYQKQRSSVNVHQDAAGNARSFLKDFPGILNNHQAASLKSGDFFGEIAALNRAPWPHTVVAASNKTQLLEIRWQGLRELMRGDAQLKRQVDTTYRTDSLTPFLPIGRDFSKPRNRSFGKHCGSHRDDYIWRLRLVRTISAPLA
ncbi:MAG: cyclic nucleotide-binding domain-containing protein [Kiritimatiellae bacterium]|nr:cyclic nucleotide-binding domain-containing protein [Kiritimatiellia bacterium]